MIRAEHLSKSFGQHLAVNDISLSVEAGQIFGLLGPNAAGKTTLIRLLCGLLQPDAGESIITDLPVSKAKQHFGYVAQLFGQYEELTVWENLTFYARLYGVTDHTHLNALLEKCGLAPFRKALAGTLSGGYKRRLALVCAITHDPQVIFLDEPTAGIDPVTRKSLWDEFYYLAAAGKTLFVTTHYMEEAERCHGLAFISAGRLVATGSPSEIRNALGDARVFTCRLGDQGGGLLPDVRSRLANIKGVRLINQFGETLRLVTTTEVDANRIQHALSEFEQSGIQILPDQPNLEDVFIALTQPTEHAA